MTTKGKILQSNINQTSQDLVKLEDISIHLIGVWLKTVIISYVK